MASHIDFESLDAASDRLAQEFATAQPFPYVVVDGFLKPESLKALLSSIVSPNLAHKSNDYIFAKNKFENPQFARDGAIMAEIREELLSPEFAAFLSKVYAKPVFVDPGFVGGGIHQGGAGSFLDMHADFNRHPAKNEWLRELNILLYLNENYKDEYGGHLELEHSTTHERARIAPELNRLVIMLTKEFTLHGYKPINFPEGAYRTSLAGYAYSIDHDIAGKPMRSTQWAPQDGPAYKRLYAKVAPAIVAIKNRFLGSNTVRRAQAGAAPPTLPEKDIKD